MEVSGNALLVIKVTMNYVRYNGYKEMRRVPQGLLLATSTMIASLTIRKAYREHMIQCKLSNPLLLYEFFWSTLMIT